MFFIQGLKAGSGDFFVFETKENAWKYFETQILVFALSKAAEVVQYVGEDVWLITDIKQFSPEGYYTIQWKSDKLPIEHHIKECVFWRQE
jgi:hypothetical protein